jgi:hypothetical protein
MAQLQLSPEEEVGITKIQARARGRAARKEVDAMRKKRAQEHYVAPASDSTKDVPLLPPPPVAVVHMQLSPEEEAGITKIQAMARGKADRAMVKEMRQKAAYLQRSPEEAEKITKIQAKADCKRVEHIRTQKAYIAAQLGHLQLNPKEEKGIIKIQAMVSHTTISCLYLLAADCCSRLLSLIC